MNYLLGKFLTIIFGINKVLAEQPGSGSPLPGGGFPSQGSQGGTYELPNPLGGVNTFAEILDRVAGYLFVIATPIVTLMILIAAFHILTAGDNPEKLKTGKQIILWTVVGYGIILISKGITLIIAQLLGS